MDVVVALFSYVPTKADELALKEGQIIRLVRKVPGGWYEGHCHGLCGWFPANHVGPFTPDPNEEKIPIFTTSQDDLHVMRYRNVLKNGQVDIPILEITAPTRMMAIREFILSESQYSDQLNQFWIEIIEPLTRESWMDTTNLSSLVEHWAPLAKFHTHLSTQLQEMLKENQELPLGAIVLKEFPTMKTLYLNYCPRLSVTASVLSEYGHQESMIRFLKGRVHTSPLILHLLTFIYKPSQHLLILSKHLQRILDTTSSQESEYSILEQCIEQVQILGECIQEERTKIDNAHLIQRIMHQLSGWEGPHLEHFGSLVLHGHLKLLDGLISKDRYFLLLEKMLVILQEKMEENVTVYRSVDMILIHSNVHVEDNGSMKFLIHRSDPMEGKKCTLLITCYSEDQKQLWMAKIQELCRRDSYEFPTKVKEELVQAFSNEYHKQGSMRWITNLTVRMKKKRDSKGKWRKRGSEEYLSSVHTSAFPSSNGTPRLSKSEDTEKTASSPESQKTSRISNDMPWNRKCIYSLGSEDGLKQKRMNTLSMLKRSSLFPIVEKFKANRGGDLRKVKSSQQIKVSPVELLMERMNQMNQEMEALKQQVHQLELKVAELSK